MTKIERYRNAKGEIWLNVGSSVAVIEDFVNIDSHFFLIILRFFPFIKWLIPRRWWERIEQFRECRERATLIRHDCRKPLPFPDGSVDHILCSHFLEHMVPVEMALIVRDFHRVLKDRATLHVIVPDLASMVDRYVDQRNNQESQAADELIKATILAGETRGSLKYRLLEFHGASGFQHRWMYDYPSLAAKLEVEGFEILDVNETPSRHVRAGDAWTVHAVARKR